MWSLDVSKQVVSALTAHFLNVLLAQLLTSQVDSENQSDACGWFNSHALQTDTNLGTS